MREPIKMRKGFPLVNELCTTELAEPSDLFAYYATLRVERILRISQLTPLGSECSKIIEVSKESGNRSASGSAPALEADH